MLIKYNNSNIKHERRLLDIDSSKTKIYTNEGYMHITLTTKTPHNLRVGDAIVFNRDIDDAVNYSIALEKLKNKDIKAVYVKNDEDIIEKNDIGEDITVTYEKGYYWIKNNLIVKVKDSELDDLFGKYNSSNDKIFIIENDFSDTSFSFSYPKYKLNQLSNVFYGENYDLIELKDSISYLCNPGETVNVKKYVNKYVYYRDEEWNDLFIEVDKSPLNSTQYMGAQIVKFIGKVYKWTVIEEEYLCKVVNKRTLQYDTGYFFSDDTVFVEDNRFIVNNSLRKDISFYEYFESINFMIPLSNSIEVGIDSEDNTKTYFEDKKKSLIPKISDYEKRCFTPCIKTNSSLIQASKINFNVFLRSRENITEWNTNDAEGWNQYMINSSGNFYKPTFNNNGENITISTNGDLLSVLNFSDEDIYFRKKKVGKTFLRLLFYDSNNPLKQMLLFYSTIFLDANELYVKYMKNLNKKTESTQLVENPTLGENNLTLSFSVYDRYYMDKSSEGFYVYLYPDNIEELLNKTIYLKVEFNHAGYGQTLPLIYPNKNNKPLSFGNNFPTSLIDKNGSLSEFYRQLYIPVTLTYDNKDGGYKYYFNMTNKVSNDEITINLYEPKINSLT